MKVYKLSPADFDAFKTFFAGRVFYQEKEGAFFVKQAVPDRLIKKILNEYASGIQKND